jgi:hypothetical protein
MNILYYSNIYLGGYMPNQYTKVDLHLEADPPLHMSNLNGQYTKALFDILKNKISPDSQLIDEIIKKVKKEL